MNVVCLIVGPREPTLACRQEYLVSAARLLYLRAEAIYEGLGVVSVVEFRLQYRVRTLMMSPVDIR